MPAVGAAEAGPAVVGENDDPVVVDIAIEEAGDDMEDAEA
jgi:hypothetical protein